MIDTKPRLIFTYAIPPERYQGVAPLVNVEARVIAAFDAFLDKATLRVEVENWIATRESPRHSPQRTTIDVYHWYEGSGAPAFMPRKVVSRHMYTIDGVVAKGTGQYPICYIDMRPRRLICKIDSEADPDDPANDWYVQIQASYTKYRTIYAIAGEALKAAKEQLRLGGWKITSFWTVEL